MQSAVHIDGWLLQARKKALSAFLADSDKMVMRNSFLASCMIRQWPTRTEFSRKSKMTSFQLIWPIVMSMVLLSACETVIEVDPPDYDSELAIISKFSPDSVWSARVTKTLPLGSLGDTTDAFLTDATVMVYREESLVARLIHDGGEDGWYVSSQLRKPRANVSYRIVVEAPGLRSVSAISMAPAPPVIPDAEISRLGATDVFEDSGYVVSFSLENRPGLNYYSFGIFLGFPLGGTTYRVQGLPMRHDSPRWFCSFRDVLNPVSVEASDDFDCSLGVSSDRFVDDPVFDFDVKVQIPSDLGNLEEVTLILFVTALSPEYVEYHGSIEEQEDFGGFGEPANIYTNLEGGRGIFAGYSASHRLFDLAVIE